MAAATWMKLTTPDVYVNPPAREPTSPDGFETETVTAPAAFVGVVAVIVLADATFTFVAKTLPNLTVAPVAKLLPVMVTIVPPETEPEFGETLLITGAVVEMYVKPAGRVPVKLSGLATTTSTLPTACAGVVAVIVLVLTTVTFVAGTPPKVTVAPPAKFAPEMVIWVPATPELGDTLLTTGVGFGMDGNRP